jgi:hypothetical protein
VGWTPDKTRFLLSMTLDSSDVDKLAGSVDAAAIGEVWRVLDGEGVVEERGRVVEKRLNAAVPAKERRLLQCSILDCVNILYECDSVQKVAEY